MYFQMKLITWDEKNLSALVQLWNDELGEEFPMRTELFKQNSFNDENVCLDSSAIAVDEAGDIVGFIIAKKYQETVDIPMDRSSGWIQALVVKEEALNQGVGSKLLAHAEDQLREKGAGKILLGRDPWHYFPGIPSEYEDAQAWFDEKGYKNIGTNHDLIRTYEAGEDDQLPERPGIEFTLIDRSERDDLLAFLKRVFPGRWEYEAYHYFEKGGQGREFVVAKKEGKIIGFCRINDGQSPFIAQNVYWDPLFEDELGGIGPLGIDQEERGQGYGLAIVEAGVAFLRKRGIERIVIDWTGLVDFYKKLGYDIWKSYKIYEKEL